MGVHGSREGFVVIVRKDWAEEIVDRSARRGAVRSPVLGLSPQQVFVMYSGFDSSDVWPHVHSMSKPSLQGGLARVDDYQQYLNTSPPCLSYAN